VDQQRGLVKKNLVFRYDPQVLVIGLTWHEKPVKFVDMLHIALQLAYVGHEEYVGLQMAYL
jgi:hypothetical protein